MKLRQLALVTTLGAGSLAQAQLGAVALAQCFEGRSQTDGRACIEAKASDAAAHLRNANKDFDSALLAWDQDSEYLRAATEAQSAASASYERHRQAKCEAVASRAPAGNRQQELRLSCHYETDTERASQVREAAMLLRARSRSNAASGVAR